MEAVGCSLGEANAAVVRWHRHHGPVRAQLVAWQLLDDNGIIRGACTVGRPVARALDDGKTVEVTRLVTDGVRNGCSFLYGIAARWARIHEYQRVVTYTSIEEPGTSLRAAGWRDVAITRASGGPPRCGSAGIKIRWEKSFVFPHLRSCTAMPPGSPFPGLRGRADEEMARLEHT